MDIRDLQNENGEVSSVKNQTLIDKAESERRKLSPLSANEMNLVARAAELQDFDQADAVAEALTDPITSVRQQLLAGLVTHAEAAQLENAAAEAEKRIREFALTGDDDFDDVLFDCIKILEVKGEDYTIGTGDRLHNFKTVAEFTGLTPEQVLGVYFYKHVSAIFSFIKKGGKSESEPIEGRIADCINYMLLFHKMVRERNRGNLK